jgi:uroporphyrin-3 C-methyltransferase
VPALVARLDELVREVDEWPLLAEAPAPAPAAGRAAKAKSAAPGKAAGQPPGHTPPPDGAWTQRLQATLADWWQQALGQWRVATQDLVRVRRVDHPDALLLAPEQAFFLRENVKLRLLNARLAVLARQFDNARADVRTVDATLRRYFDTESPRLQPTLRTLTELQRALRAEMLPRPDDTLAALAAAAGGR